MLLLVLSILWCATIAIMLIRAIRQYGFYQVIGPDAEVSSDAPCVAVIVPARNEARNIGRCLEGLLAQQYPRERLSIVVVDDNSTDQTAGIIADIAARDARVRLIDAGALPAGWLGKPRACAVGAQNAGDAEYLCFCDADTVAQPLLLNTAVKAAQDRGAALLSLEPFAELVLPCERLVVPGGFFLLAFTQDVRRASDPADPQAHANGQFMLIQRSAYEAVGTFAAVRDQIAEDSAIARLIKKSGGKVCVLGTKDLIAARMYRSFGAMFQGLSRQAGQLLGSPSRTLVFAMFALACAVLTPMLPILSGFQVGASASNGWHGLVLMPVPSTQQHGQEYQPMPPQELEAKVDGVSFNRAIAIASLIFACVGSLALLGTHIGVARYFKIPWWYGILFPIGYTIGAGLLLHSALARWRGRVPWKGREYAWTGPLTEQSLSNRSLVARNHP